MKKSVENLATSKITGGRRYPLRTRRKYEIDRYSVEAIPGPHITVPRKVRGSNAKTSLKTTDFVNLALEGGKVKKVKITKVIRNPASSDYERRGVISKGAVLETEAGQCKVVSRPGQDGAVNAVLTK
ncbi:MAG: 30S ribosomal protein S8e [Thaumarchaeota archaeon]|nr:30S ribosomal protein S8e [Nitrososphaerota archaeon]